MPLIKRAVEPVELSRAHVAQGIRNELECVTNNTLSNVIRQLSSLSKHAEDMFGELFQEASSVFRRANNLQDRVDKLKVKVTQLDSTQDVVSLQDINMRKPFKSSVIREQQIISKRSRPTAIQETYLNCDSPPALSKLNIFREDGKDSIKFYTDATYFFELWCQQMQKDTERQQKKFRKGRYRSTEDLDDLSGHHHHRKFNTLPLMNQPQRPKRPVEHKVKVTQIQSRQAQYSKLAMGKEFAPEQSNRQINYAEAHYQGTPQQQQPNRPNSLEVVPKHGEYINPNQQYAMTEQQRQSMLQQDGGGYHSNGPVNKHNSSIENNDMRASFLQQQQQNNHHHHQQTGSPYGTPERNSRLQYSNSSVGSPVHRPMTRPPPIPSASLSDMGSKTNSRESLPPPPPPPQMDIINTQYTTQQQDYPGMMDIRRSPARSIDSHGTSSSHASAYSRDGTPNSVINDPLPPPPPSPPTSSGTPSSMNSIPPPPPPPPPMNGGFGPGVTVGGANIPPPPPPPPPGPPPPPSAGGMNGDISSSGSGSQVSTGKAAAPAPMHDARSDLLDAIKAGINLRKVEEQEQKKDRQRRNTAGHLDVQAIMEAAFEMRRQAMERDSDEECEEEEADGDWSDDDS